MSNVLLNFLIENGLQGGFSLAFVGAFVYMITSLNHVKFLLSNHITETNKKIDNLNKDIKEVQKDIKELLKKIYSK